MHWATSQRKVLSLTESEMNHSLEGNGKEGDEYSESSSSTSRTHAQDDCSTASKSSLLEEFRKGMTIGRNEIT